MLVDNFRITIWINYYKSSSNYESIFQLKVEILGSIVENIENWACIISENDVKEGVPL